MSIINIFVACGDDTGGQDEKPSGFSDVSAYDARISFGGSEIRNKQGEAIVWGTLKNYSGQVIQITHLDFSIVDLFNSKEYADGGVMLDVQIDDRTFNFGCYYYAPPEATDGLVCKESQQELVNTTLPDGEEVGFVFTFSGMHNVPANHNIMLGFSFNGEYGDHRQWQTPTLVISDWNWVN